MKYEIWHILGLVKKNNLVSWSDKFPKSYHLYDSRIVSFWANALHREVFPVPGGPGMKSDPFITESALDC